MKNRIQRVFLTLFIAIFAIFPNIVYAYSDYIIASGENVGIEVKVNGAMIVGTYSVNKIYPASDAGLFLGDIITSVNGKKISNVTSLMDSLKQLESLDKVKIEYIRNKKSFETVLNVVYENDEFKTGIYVKDAIIGIGTLTYVDPNTRLFGALGHEIIEKNSGHLLETTSGTIFSSIVTNIQPSTGGSPGEKNARYFTDQVYGNIFENTKKGIFGNYTSDINTNKLYKVAQPNEIEKGDAYIRTVVDGNNVKEYKIKIDKVIHGQDIKNISFEIVDEELLNITGGIIQGMSGSPIIQNDKVVGAVTHMVIEKPAQGYGIFITTMLEEAEK